MEIGQKAPAFALYNSDRKEIKSTDLLGKPTVILFFPLAFTSTCTTELCSVRDDIASYQNLGAEVLAISVDSPMVLNKFKEEQNLNMTLLSDFNRVVSAAFNSLYDTFILNMKGVSKRSAFVLDKEGTVRYAEVLENASEIPDLEKVKATLAKLK